jgi:Acyl-CoA dehydrogenase, C-terminal domain
MMDFTPAESQQAVAALAADILAAPDPWKELARAGLLDASALGVLDTTCLLTEIGRRAPSLKALATLMTGALPLARWGLRADLIPAVASGELLLTAALREPSNPQPTPPATTITDGKLSGTKVGVPYAQQAALILVPSMIVASLSQIEPKTGHDHGVALVDPHAAGVTLTRTPSSSGEPEYTLRMHGAPVEGMLGGADCVRDLYQLAIAGACALADGAVAGALARAGAVMRVNELLNWHVASSGGLGPAAIGGQASRVVPPEANRASSPALDVADASVTKVFSSEQLQVIGQELAEAVGRHGDPADPDTAALLTWLDVQLKRNTVLTFGGGVNEVQRELIAAAGLGLPRAPR